MISKLNYYFILSFSPWPLLTSLNSLNLVLSILMLLKNSNVWLILINLANLTISSFIWWVTYSSEFNLEGKNSFNMEQGLKMSMMLFISSEVFFFFSFFWSYFHFFLAPTMEIGMVWPPILTEMFNFENVPLINTLLLLSSGITVTMSHQYLISGKFKKSNILLFLTIILGLIFSMLQLMEYKSSFFMISDSTFGTSFFMLTGFHGIHVMIGTIFLATTLYRNLKLASSFSEYLSFEMASWYWHFVDVVWIFLYFMLYYLNN